MEKHDQNRIEETLAHQEQQINDLSEMIISQSRDIAALQKDIQKLQGKLSNIENGNDTVEANQKPPHY